MLNTKKNAYKQAVQNNRRNIERQIKIAIEYGEPKLLCVKLFKENVKYFKQQGYTVNYDKLFDDYDIIWGE